MLIITCATQAVYMDLPPCGTDVVSAQVTHPNGIIWNLTVSTVRHEDGSARVALTNWPFPPVPPTPPPPAPAPPPISAGAYTVTVTTGCGCHTVQVYLRCPPPAFQPVDMTPPGTPRPYVSCTSTSEDEQCLR